MEPAFCEPLLVKKTTGYYVVRIMSNRYNGGFFASLQRINIHFMNIYTFLCAKCNKLLVPWKH
jgi:hypothetical protein